MPTSTTVSTYPQPGNGAGCFHPADEPSNSVSPCFHPGDEDGEPMARHFEPDNGRPCFHPGDDLAADLHLALTDIDERQLAVLAGSRP